MSRLDGKPDLFWQEFYRESGCYAMIDYDYDGCFDDMLVYNERGECIGASNAPTRAGLLAAARETIRWHLKCRGGRSVPCTTESRKV